MLRKLLSQVFSTQRARETPQRAAVTASVASGNDLIAQLERARACEKRGDPEAALACYQACAASYPDGAPAHLGAANALSDLWRMDECIEASARAAALEPQALPLFSALLYHSHFATDVDSAELFRLHREYGERVAAQIEPLRTHPKSREPDRKLRIGYLSANFSRHSVGYFVEPLLAGHDRNRFEVYCYYTHPYSDDATQRLASAADAWRHVHARSDSELANDIVADGIDILIDLAGHTAMNRLAVLARKPAPVQITWLGYPDTTGVQAIDYRITDPVADPAPDAEAVHTERLLRIDSPFLCYQPPDDSPPLGVRAGDRSVVFGSFNALTKLNANAIRLWSRILERVPHSRLLLKAGLLTYPATRSRVMAAFASEGIATERLELRPWQNTRSGHLQSYDEIDIALDTFPYNGTTTTCEALWMGVPVIGLRGEMHMARVGATLLESAGLRELVADSDDQYVELAVHLADDRERLTDLRSSMRDKLSQSRLLDRTDFVRRFEGALRTAWTGWCSRADS